MPLECVMILIDNSSYARNGDALPTRLQAQFDATAALVNHKTNDNMETYVGLMTCSGSGDILITPTNEASAIYSCFGRVQVGGQLSLARSLQIASLALKHRVNKNQRERIVVFVASEIRDSPEDLFLAARSLRRNNTSVDIVNICNESNLRLLQQFLEIVNIADSCKLLNYQGGLNILTDALRSSGLLGGAADDNGGFQEEMDPELEMALRISMEEEKRRLEELERKRTGGEGGNAAPEQTPARGAMLIEKAGGDEEEKESLISKANEMVEEENDKGKQTGAGQTKENEYIKDPAFIKEILKDLQIDTDEKKKKDEEDKNANK